MNVYIYKHKLFTNKYKHMHFTHMYTQFLHICTCLHTCSHNLTHTAHTDHHEQMHKHFLHAQTWYTHIHTHTHTDNTHNCTHTQLHAHSCTHIYSWHINTHNHPHVFICFSSIQTHAIFIPPLSNTFTISVNATLIILLYCIKRSVEPRGLYYKTLRTRNLQKNG